MKKLFTLFLAFVVSAGTMLASTKIGVLCYELNVSYAEASVTSSYSGKYSGAIVIPPSVWYDNMTYSVTSIGSGAFSGCTGLTSIEIPNSVTSIGSSAFFGCTGLTSIEIPNSVTFIGSSAFFGCTGLTSIEIPNSVTSIGYNAFSGCTGLTSIEIPNSVTSIGSNAFSGCSSIVSLVVESGNATYDSRNNSNAIMETATNTLIAGCKKSIIPNSVTSIGEAAFYGCTGLTSIEIPYSVTSIGGNAFNGCIGLTSVEIPNSVISIGSNAFSGCTGLPIEDNLRYADTYLVGATDNSLSTYMIKPGTRWIGSGAFSGCTGLTSVEIPNSVTSIGGSAFSWCPKLTSVEIPNSVKSIGESAFIGCTGLTSLLMPDSVAEFGRTVYGADTNLVSLKFPANLTREDCSDEYGHTVYYSIIGEYHPTDNTSSYPSYNDLIYHIRNIDAPAWFFDIPEKYWMYCPKQLENVIVSNFELTSNVLAVIARSYKTLKSLDLSGVTNTELADEALKNFYNVTELKLPKNTERIGYMSVAECVKLQSIDIPASVKEIEDRAFENCRSIKSITFGGKQPASMPGRNNARSSSTSELQRIGNWAFYNCHELQNLEIPEGVTEIGDGAFYGCTYLEDLSLPASVQSIGDNTFALCAKMKKIIVNAVTPPSIQAKTFFDVKRQIPVYVPDECVEAYKNDTYWKEFNIQGRSSMPQAIDQITSDQSSLTKKVIKDGQILIIRGEKRYTMQGQEVR